MGDTDKNWWPSSFAHWPSDVAREATLESFVESFARLGYERCDDASLENGHEKVVLYAKPAVTGTMVPTHAAKQLPNGWWTSKLGQVEDIEHEKPEDLSGPTYGSPVLFLRRPLVTVTSSRTLQ